MEKDLYSLLKAAELAGFIVVTDRKGRTMICSNDGTYVATIREMIPGDYVRARAIDSPSR